MGRRDLDASLPLSISIQHFAILFVAGCSGHGRALTGTSLVPSAARYAAIPTKRGEGRLFEQLFVAVIAETKETQEKATRKELEAVLLRLSSCQEKQAAFSPWPFRVLPL